MTDDNGIFGFGFLKTSRRQAAEVAKNGAVVIAQSEANGRGRPHLGMVLGALLKNGKLRNHQ